MTPPTPTVSARLKTRHRWPDVRHRLAWAIACSGLGAALWWAVWPLWAPAWPTLAMALSGLLVWGALLWLALPWVLRPIDDLAQALWRAQVPSEPSAEAPIDPASALPVEARREMDRLCAAIDHLLARQHAWRDQQNRFVADASHQLRTPFAVLRTQLQGLMSGQLQADETLPRMLATVDRAAHLTRQLLSRAKVEQLLDRRHWVAVDLQKIAQEVASEFAPLLARKRLDFSLQAVPIVLQTDPWLLGELLRNLLSNAIHHAPVGSALGVVIRRLPDEAEMIVWDNAGGVDEALRDRLFKPFESAAGGTGIGLGLSICQQIAVSMSAQVALYNRVQDQRVIGLDAVVRWPQAGAETVESVSSFPATPVVSGAQSNDGRQAHRASTFVWPSAQTRGAVL